MIEAFLSHCFLTGFLSAEAIKAAVREACANDKRVGRSFRNNHNSAKNLNTGITTTTMCLVRNDCLVAVVIVFPGAKIIVQPLRRHVLLLVAHSQT